MILSDFLDQDQMVPEFDFVSTSIDSGATVVERPFPEEKTITDLDSLLADINSTIEADTRSPPSYADISANTNMDVYRLYPAHNYQTEDLSLYDDIPTHMIKKEKPDDLQFGAIQGTGEGAPSEYHPHQDMRYSAPCEPQTPLPSDGEIEKLHQDVEKTCRELGISPSPYDWSHDDVKRWVRRTFQEYQLPEQSAEEIDLDGTSLCMLSEEDYKGRWPQFGEYIYVTLLWWKNATLSLGAAAASSNEYEEPPTYTDISNMTTNQVPHHLPAHHTFPPPHHHHQHHQQQQHQQQHHLHNMQQLHHHQHHHQQMMEHHQHHHHPPPPPAYVSPHCSAANTNSMLAVNPMETLPINIPKPVFSAPISLGSQSPSPSPSMDSSSSTYNPSPRSYLSEHELYEMGLHDSKEMTPTKQNTHLWQFLRELLLSPRHYGGCIRWLDRSKGIFKIEDSARVALLWGRRKNRPAMNYDKLSRSIRQYYKKNIIKKTDNSKRLVYQFCAPYRA